MTRWRTISETTPAKRAMPIRRGKRGAVGALAREARADRDVRVAGDHRLEQGAELARVVLAVAVDLDGDVEVMLGRILDARLNGGADAEVVRQAEHGCAGRAGELGGAVGRAVVDDDDLEVGVEVPDLGDDLRDGARLVVGRDDGRFPHTAVIGGFRRPP